MQINETTCDEGTGMAETGLIERLVERAVAAQLEPLQLQLQAQHWLLTELVRQMPRAALLDMTRRLDQVAGVHPQKDAARAAWGDWQLYLRQQAALVEGDTPPPLPPGLRVPERLPPLR
jgi:hypothetical protein